MCKNAEIPRLKIGLQQPIIFHLRKVMGCQIGLKGISPLHRRISWNWLELNLPECDGNPSFVGISQCLNAFETNPVKHSRIAAAEPAYACAFNFVFYVFHNVSVFLVPQRNAGAGY